MVKQMCHMVVGRDGLWNLSGTQISLRQEGTVAAARGICSRWCDLYRTASYVAKKKKKVLRISELKPALLLIIWV